MSGVAKPPVLSRGTQRALCLACLAVIVYGTLGPLGTGEAPWLVAVGAWRWVPTPEASDLNDVLTNFAVYLPVGIAFRLLVRRRGRAGWPDLLLGVTLSVALSYATEVLQQAMPSRSSSLMDVFVNGFAAFVGCLWAVPAQRALRRLHAFTFSQPRVPWRLWTTLAWLSAAVTAVLMTMPWNLAPPVAKLGFEQPLGPADVKRFAMFAVVGFLITGAAILRGQARLLALTGGLLLAGLLATLLEASQAVLHAHVCSLLHGIVAVAGASVGCTAAGALLKPGALTGRATGSSADATRVRHRLPSGRLRKLAAVGLAATMVCVVAAGVWRDPRLGELRAEPAVEWMPFRAHFVAPFPVMVTDILEQVSLYAFLTLTCLFLTRGRGRAIALLLLVGLVGSIEVCQALLSNRGANTTAPLLAALAWVLTTRLWTSIYPRVRSEYGAQPACTADPPASVPGQDRATNAASALPSPR